MMYVLFLLPALVVGLAFLVLGNTHTGILFSTSVPVEFRSSEKGRSILRDYRSRGLVMLVFFAVSGVAAAHGSHVWLNGILLPAEIVAWFALYYVAVRQTRPFAVQPPLIRTASLSGGDSIKPLVAGMFAALLPLLAAGVYLHLHCSQLPAAFPVHWGIDGRANRWSERTVSGVYQSIWTGAGMILLMLAIGVSTRYARGSEGLRKLTRRILLLSAALISFTFVAVALLPLIHFTASSKMPRFAVALAFGIPGLFVAIILLWAVRSQSQQGETSEPYDGSPDACWHGGMFYFNPKDRAILVPKRFGIGYSLNFAHPAAWIFLLVLLLPVGFFLLHHPAP